MLQQRYEFRDVNLELHLCKPPPEPRLINIEGNSGGNNVLLTVHALPLRGGLAPCIPASQTHAPQCDSLLEKKKTKKQ